MLGHHDGTRDGQALACALAHFLGGEEGVEDSRADGLGNSCAVSAMSIRTWSPSLNVLMRIVPLPPPWPTTSPMAWAALTMRLRKTWFRSPTWQSTGGRSPNSVVTSSHVLVFVLGDSERGPQGLVQVGTGLFPLVGGVRNPSWPAQWS